MADYIYLLETRLSPAQQRAIGSVRTIAREFDATVFLTGGAVRDLTGGGSVRDLDLTVQGDVFRLRKALADAGAEIVGENAPASQLFLLFPGGVRVELSSAVCVTWPKPGKPKFDLGSITDDLRRRDFTANAMAISLNEGSYGLLMDPLNGVADIENRELRLVSNYGFIEDPARLIRVARLMSRLGWQMEEKTRQRYETAKEEGYVSALGNWSRGYELEEIFHEEDPVRVLRALETEGWLTALSPSLNATKANTAALAELHERQGQLQMQGILSQPAAIAFPLVTAKLSPSEVVELKGMFVRPGFVREVDTLEARTKDFATQFASKEASAPSAAWKILHAAEPNLVLAMSFGSKSASVQSRLKTFLTDSPAARQRIPYALLTEMRITQDLPVYAELLDKLFFELMDSKLSTPEEMKAYLEPYSPPAPPPPVNLRRARAKKEARPSRAKAKKSAVSVAAEDEAAGLETGLTEVGDLTGPDRGPEPSPREPISKVAPQPEVESAPVEMKAVTAKKPTTVVKVAPSKSQPAPAKKPAPAKAATSKVLPAKQAPAKSVAKKDVPTKATPAKAPAKVTPTKAPLKAAAKKTVAAQKAAPKKAAPAKKAAAAKKATPAKKAAPAKKAVPAKAAKKAVAKKSSRR
jgi:tRNA nucleotidyltransferase/poly(A) polymerase